MQYTARLCSDAESAKEFSPVADWSLVKAEEDQTNPRSAFRRSMIAGKPVYLLLNIDGMDIDPIVDELGGGGARLVSAKHFDRFHIGQHLGPAVLALQEEGMPVVYPIVKWKSWPVIGIEFLETSEKDHETILRFLFKVERRTVQQRRNQTVRRRLR